MTTVISAPGKYVQGKDEITRLEGYVTPFGKKALAVVDGFILDNFTDTIKGSFSGSETTLILERFHGECSKTEINRLIEILKKQGGDVVVGIGGGKTLDTAKAVGYYTNLPVVICPTIASTDAPCSALSVLYTDDGQFDEYLFLRQNPNVVVVDTGMVVNAPARLLVAGMGDALATYFEARACVTSCATNMVGGKATAAAYALSEKCYEILITEGELALLAAESKQVTKAVENIIEANTYLSGIGFESCGLAASHAVHNGLTVLGETHHMNHGEKVAFGTLVQLVLENAPEEELQEVLCFCKKIGLPTTLAALGLENPTDEQLTAVAEASCAEGDTMGNMPFPVTPADVVAAIKVADKLGSL